MQPRRNDARIVDDEDIAWSQLTGQVEDRAILERRRAMRPHDEEPSRIARLGGAQRNTFGREIKIEEIYTHAGQIVHASGLHMQPAADSHGKTIVGCPNLPVNALVASIDRCGNDFVGIADGFAAFDLVDILHPDVTFPQTVYCLSRKRASPKQMKN